MRTPDNITIFEIEMLKFAASFPKNFCDILAAFYSSIEERYKK